MRSSSALKRSGAANTTPSSRFTLSASMRASEPCASMITRIRLLNSVVVSAATRPRSVAMSPSSRSSSTVGVGNGLPGNSFGAGVSGDSLLPFESTAGVGRSPRSSTGFGASVAGLSDAAGAASAGAAGAGAEAAAGAAASSTGAFAFFLGGRAVAAALTRSQATAVNHRLARFISGLGSLRSDRCRGARGGLGIPEVVARLDRLQRVVELVDQRDTRRDVELDDLGVRDVVEVFDQRAQAVAVRGD